jgi:hypothetical protein
MPECSFFSKKFGAWKNPHFCWVFWHFGVIYCGEIVVSLWWIVW